MRLVPHSCGHRAQASIAGRMNLALSPESMAWLDAQVRGGHFASYEEAIDYSVKLTALREIFFYLMLLAGAFIGILAAILSARPDVPFGIVMLGLMGLLAGQMMYRWRFGITGVTVLVVAITVAAMGLGPMGQHQDERGALVQGPVAASVSSA